MKILLVVYIFILAVIIFLADRKGTRYMLNFVGNIPYGDKLGHFLLMGGFSFLLNLVLNARTFSLWKCRYLLGSSIVLIVVTLEEFSQMFVSGRTFDWSDLVFDYLGIFLLGELARFVLKRKAQH
jgi:VanZ family protein